MGYNYYSTEIRIWMITGFDLMVSLLFISIFVFKLHHVIHLLSGKKIKDVEAEWLEHDRTIKGYWELWVLIDNPLFLYHYPLEMLIMQKDKGYVHAVK